MNREFELQVESAKNEVREAGRVQVMCFRFYSAGSSIRLHSRFEEISRGKLPDNPHEKTLIIIPDAGLTCWHSGILRGSRPICVS